MGFGLARKLEEFVEELTKIVVVLRQMAEMALEKDRRQS